MPAHTMGRKPTKRFTNPFPGMLTARAGEILERARERLPEIKKGAVHFMRGAKARAEAAFVQAEIERALVDLKKASSFRVRAVETICKYRYAEPTVLKEILNAISRGGLKEKEIARMLAALERLWVETRNNAEANEYVLEAIGAIAVSPERYSVTASTLAGKILQSIEKFMLDAMHGHKAIYKIAVVVDKRG